MTRHSTVDALIATVERPLRGRDDMEEYPGWVIEAARRLAPEDRSRGIAYLCRRVEEHDDSIACAALAAIGAREAISTLRHAMEHGRSAWTRRGAARALEALGETEGVIPTLIELVQRGSLDAAIDLRNYRGEAIVEALTAGLEHPERLVRYHCAVSLLMVREVIQDPDSDEFGELVLWLSSGWACGRRLGREGLELLLKAKQDGGDLSIFRGGYKIARNRRTPAFVEVQEWIIERTDPPEPRVLGRVNASERRWLAWAMLRGLEETFDADTLAVLRYLDSELADEVEAEHAGQRA